MLLAKNPSLKRNHSWSNKNLATFTALNLKKMKKSKIGSLF